MPTNEENSNMHPRDPATTNILVVGDWLVDEHWVMGVYRSRTSSRVGDAHYRSIQTLDSSVTSFCGAGRTAAILHRARSTGNDNLYGIIGLGVWHENDGQALEAVLDSSSVTGCTPHQITFSYAPKSKRQQLINLIHQPKPDWRPGTTRVIRVYQQTGPKVKLIERLDWEVKRPEEGWFTESDLKAHEALTKALAEARPAAIVVKDMLKGVVCPEVIKFLAKQLPGIPWYISSKRFLPDWIGPIDKKLVRLLEIPQVATQDAVKRNKISAWLTRLGGFSKDALDLVDSLGETYQNALIVAVPNDQTILAYRRHGPDGVTKEGVDWENPHPNPLSVGLPMASVCFAAFTAHLLTTPTHPLPTLVDLSLSFTEKWRNNEAGRIVNPVEWNPLEEERLVP